MLGKWFNKPRDTSSAFRGLENSTKLDETYKLARELPGDPYFDDSLRAHLDERYGINDAESYDCHSFVASVAKREFAAGVVTAPSFEKPDREKFDSEAEWAYELQKAAEKMMETPEGKQFVQSQKSLTINISKNSEQIPIPHVQIIDEASVDRKRSIAEIITKDVAREITRKGASRVLLFSADHGGEFHDVHSSIILGLTKDGKDVLLLEKFQLGDPVHVRKLSDVIDLQMLPYSENLALNILRKPIARIAN